MGTKICNAKQKRDGTSYKNVRDKAC